MTSYEGGHSDAAILAQMRELAAPRFVHRSHGGRLGIVNFVATGS